MHSHINQQPSTHPLNDGPNPSTNPTTPLNEFIHNFSDIDWQMDEEPPYPNNPAYPHLYYLLTITGQLLIGYYPHNTHELGEHFLAWAPLQASDALLH